jgi:hypothetical protein
MRTIATRSGGRRTQWIKLKSLLLMLRIPSMWVFHSSPWKKILHKDIAIQNVSTPPSCTYFTFEKYENCVKV